MPSDSVQPRKAWLVHGCDGIGDNLFEVEPPGVAFAGDEITEGVWYPLDADPAELVRVLLDALPEHDNIGSMGAGTADEYECEECGAMHEDWSQIEHAEGCYAPKLRAALSRAKEWQKGGDDG